MAIEDIIAQGVKGPQVETPTQNYQRLMQMQMQQRQIAAAGQEEQMRAIELDKARRERDQVQAMNDTYKEAFTIGPDGKPKIDQNKIVEGLSRRGFGSAAPDVLAKLTAHEKMLADLANTQATTGKTQAETEAAERNAAGSLGATVQAAGNDPQLFTSLLKHSVDANPAHAQHLQPMIDSVNQALLSDPTGEAAKKLTGQYTNTFIGMSPEQQKLANEKLTADARSKQATTGADKLQDERDTTFLNRAAGAKSQGELDQLRKDAQTLGASTKAVGQLPAMFSPQTMQDFGRRMMTAEQRTQADQSAATLDQTKKRDAQTASFRQQELAQGAQRISQENQKFQATYGAGLDGNGHPLSPAELKASAEQDPVAVAIFNYQAPDVSLSRSPLAIATMRKVYALDPNHDGTKFGERNKVVQAYSSAGAEGKKITSADTALAHLDRISRAGQALAQNNIPLLNQIQNELGYHFGGSAQNIYDGIVSMVAPEITRAVVGEAGGQGEREHYADKFNSRNNAATREGTLRGVADLLWQRVQKQAHAYEFDMDRPLDLDKRMSAASKQVLQRYGIQAHGDNMQTQPGGGGSNQQQTQPGGGGNQQPQAKISVTDPRGVTHTFPTQQQADDFKKAAGIK